MDYIKNIYCDFDGTITKLDAVNTFFELYADEKWKDYEAQWVAGKISSRENAIKQVGLLKEITPKELSDYIDSIEIDEYFLEFLDFIKDKGIKFTILSDGFDLFISEVLKRHGIKNVEFYANHLIYENNRFRIEFPYYNENCLKGSGMCKCAKIKEKDFCYIGDGTSDLCVAHNAKLLFATKSLCKYCVTNNIEHVKFVSFRDIINFINVNNGVHIYGSCN